MVLLWHTLKTMTLFVGHSSGTTRNSPMILKIAQMTHYSTYHQNTTSLLTCVSGVDLKSWSEIGSSCHFEGKAGKVDNHVRDEKEHGHKWSNGVQLAKKQGDLREREGGREERREASYSVCTCVNVCMCECVSVCMLHYVYIVIYVCTVVRVSFVS